MNVFDVHVNRAPVAGTVTWSLVALSAVMIVMVVWPALFIGSQLLAVLAMGFTIGAGAYFAWVSRGSLGIGYSAALAGAFVGAWLGFNAAAGLIAALTTLVGAAIGANLCLVALDVVWDRSGPAPQMTH